APGAAPITCDAMNGNCVLIPAEVAAVVGNLDYTFKHAMGDFDYALRARRKGFQIWLAAGFFGTCKHNLTTEDFINPRLPLNVRLRSILDRKNLPPRAWGRYARRHAGPLWPAYWAWPYLKVFMRSIHFERGLKRKTTFNKSRLHLIREITPPFIWRK